MHEGRRLLINTLGVLTAGGLTLLAASGCGIEAQTVPEEGKSLPIPTPEKTPVPLEFTPTAILLPTFDRALAAIRNRQPTHTLADSKNAAATVKALTSTPLPTVDIPATAAAIARARAGATARSIATTTGSTPTPEKASHQPRSIPQLQELANTLR